MATVSSRRSGRVQLMLQGRRHYEVAPERWDLDLRLQAMDQMGGTIQALSMVPQLQVLVDKDPVDRVYVVNVAGFDTETRDGCLGAGVAS